MKKLLAMLLVPFFSLQAQTVSITPNLITQDLNGGAIEKGDTIKVIVKVNPSSVTRSIYFDFQHQYTAISLIDVTMAPAGGQGSAIPAGATTNVQNYFYQNCRFNRTAQNTTSEGWTNYMNANYTCDVNAVPNHAINRIYANVSSNTALSTGDYMYLRFKITNVSAGFSYDSIYMNFAAGYKRDGTQETTTLGPRTSWVQLAPGANNLLTGNIKYGINFPYGPTEVHVMTDASNPQLVAKTTPTPSGDFSFSSELQPNTSYRLYMFYPGDSLAKLSQNATTVSDYTTAYQEFLTQNLNGTFKNSNISKGIMYRAADINNNSTFDGGDVQLLFNAVTGLDTIVKKPVGCSNMCMVSLPVAYSNVYDTLSVTGWKGTTSFGYLPFTTTTANQTINVRYFVRGDVNLSHSSAVTNMAGMMSSMMANNGSSIDVNLSNVVVTSNTITIPFNVDSKTTQLSGLQFEVTYDPTKVKFEKLNIDTPSWISFVNVSNGVLRFGAIDRELKNPISGNGTPFKLVFSSVQAGVDLNSAVMVTPVMDAADNKGNQVGINLNTTVVKLIGANNFFRP